VSHLYYEVPDTVSGTSLQRIARLARLEIVAQATILEAIKAGILTATHVTANEAAELTINAYHELGEMLGEVDKNRGAAAKRADTVSARLDTLKDLLDMPKWSAQQLSKHAQLVARIPEDRNLS
jgi:hypothetical protein